MCVGNFRITSTTGCEFRVIYGLRYEMIVTLWIPPRALLRYFQYIFHAVQSAHFFSSLSLQIPGFICEDFNDSVGLGRTNP